ncbi:MAG: ATP-binding cassette domain-containing protein, partial [Moraxella sp.]|nr:ATP-binding cassette domain-containing protein [Moraxella sp.]
MSVLLSFERLSICIDGNALLQSATGQILAGERIVLTGKSGSGKSLLLQALAQLIPYTGTLHLNNTPAHHFSMAQWRHQVSLIGQVPQFVAGTVLDNLTLPFGFEYHHKRGIAFDIAWHKEHLHTLGKDGDFLYKDISVLSGGERQLVNFLRTLQLNPTVVLLDEPTAALDTESTKALIQLFFDYQATQNQSQCPCACIWISH